MACIAVCVCSAEGGIFFVAFRRHCCGGGGREMEEEETLIVCVGMFFSPCTMPFPRIHMYATIKALD